MTNTTYILDEAYNGQKTVVISSHFRYATLLGTPVLMQNWHKELKLGTD
jgi:hypothetical protein